MSDRLSDAFNACLAALESGVGLQVCLDLYPDLAAELRPALEAATAARSMSQIGVPTAAMHRSRDRVVAMAQAMRRRRPIAPLRSFPRVAFAGLAALLAAFLGLGGLVAASAQSLPGDVLYPIKRAGESVSLELSASAAARQSLQEDYSQRRSSEVQSLLDMSRSAPVSFQGVVRRQSADSLLVGNIPVSLPKDTEIVGKIEDGVTVEVEGETQRGRRAGTPGPAQVLRGRRTGAGHQRVPLDGSRN